MVTIQDHTKSYDSNGSHTVLKARIALLATAIGGPDYSSRLDPPPYKLGDDCLACLKDLKRWFKLVDDQQNRWDVGMAVAEYRILIDDLLPIIIDWENKSSLANKLSRKNAKDDDTPQVTKSREYHDSIALNCLQLMVILTWPLILNEQSTAEQVRVYSDLKKYQLVYKKHILSMEKGKVLKAATRLASKVVKMDKTDRTPRDNMIIRLTLNFFRNILSIEPGEVNIAKNRSVSNRGINITDTFPPNVTMDDISLNAVISAFHHNKVLGLLLLLSGSNEFDNDFIDVPLMEVMFQLTKEINQESLYKKGADELNEDEKAHSNNVSSADAQLTELLQKEKLLKKNVIQNTSTRHSRFGALLSIQTADNSRLTVSGGCDILNDSSALKKIDNRKKWNKRAIKKRDDMVIEGLPNSLLNTQNKLLHLSLSTVCILKKFIDSFIDSGFHLLLRRLTNHFTTEEDQMIALEQIEYLLFFAWFTKGQRMRCGIGTSADLSFVAESMEETVFILVSSLLRKSYHEKNWVVVHAGMIAFNELLQLVSVAKENYYDDSMEFILSRLLSDDRIKLLADIPKQAFKHTIQYMKSCVDITYTALKLFEQYDDKDPLIISKKSNSKQASISEGEIRDLMQSQDVDRDEALEILQPSFRKHEINFAKVQRVYICESTVETYINLLQRFRELEDSYIKKGISFLHRVVTQESEEPLLFRIDFIMLLRDMLSTNGISRKSSVRKHVESFSNFFLYRLKRKFKSSNSWFIGLLFPLLHNGEVGYFQKYGERKLQDTSRSQVVAPSIFKRIENEEELPASHLLDLRYGILVSALIDEGKSDILDILVKQLTETLDIFKSFLSMNVSNGSELSNPPNEYFKGQELSDPNPLVFDSYFRALLQLIGYHIPESLDDTCFLPGSVEIPNLQKSLDYIQKHLSTPFETKNGLPSSSYLIKPREHIISEFNEDRWSKDEYNNYERTDIASDHNMDEDREDSYFDDLNKDMHENLDDRTLEKGVAKSRKPKKTKKVGGRNRKLNRQRIKSNLPTFETDQMEETHSTKERQHISSKEYISDSDDEDGIMNPIFFENEIYMRFLLDKYGGQLPDDKFAQFGRFAAERMNNNGSVTTNFTDLFGGNVPNIDLLTHSNTSTTAPDRSLISLTNRVSMEIDLAVRSEEVAVQIQPAVSSEEDFSEDHEAHPSSVHISAPTTEKSDENNITSTLKYNGDISPLRNTSTVENEEAEHLFVSRKRRKVFVQDDEED